LSDLGRFTIGTDPYANQKLDIAPKELIDASVKTMDAAHLFADRITKRSIGHVDYSWDYLKHVFRRLVTGDSTTDEISRELIERLEDYNDENTKRLKVDELNILSGNKSIAAAYRAAIALEKELCKDKICEDYISMILILSEYCVYKHLYDLQKHTGYAFPVDGYKSVVASVNRAYEYHVSFVENYVDQLFGEIDLIVSEAGYTLNGFAVGKPDIEEAINYMGYSITRLYHTETTDLNNEAQSDVAETVNIKYYKYITERDSKVCELCRALEGKEFRYIDREVGKNFPPIHPNCRCQHAFILKAVSIEHIRKMTEIDNRLYNIVPDSMDFAEWLYAWGVEVEFDGWFT
jgi:SPP1 gp7 family putative phage head morphogenesis protein